MNFRRIYIYRSISSDVMINVSRATRLYSTRMATPMHRYIHKSTYSQWTHLYIQSSWAKCKIYQLSKQVTTKVFGQFPRQRSGGNKALFAQRGLILVNLSLDSGGGSSAADRSTAIFYWKWSSFDKTSPSHFWGPNAWYLRQVLVNHDAPIWRHTIIGCKQR